MEWLSTHPMSTARAELENGDYRLAEEIAGTVYVRLETGADLTRIPAGRRPVNQRRTIRIGMIVDTHCILDPAVRHSLLAGVAERRYVLFS